MVLTSIGDKGGLPLDDTKIFWMFPEGAIFPRDAFIPLSMCMGALIFFPMRWWAKNVYGWLEPLFLNFFYPNPVFFRRAFCSIFALLVCGNFVYLISQNLGYTESLIVPFGALAIAIAYANEHA
jgi:hypothetical protein